MRTLQRFISLSHPVNWVSFAYRWKGIAGQWQRVVDCRQWAGWTPTRGSGISTSSILNHLCHPGRKVGCVLLFSSCYTIISVRKGFRIVFTSEKMRNHHKYITLEKTSVIWMDWVRKLNTKIHYKESIRNCLFVKWYLV